MTVGVSTLALHPTGSEGAHLSLRMLLALPETPEYRACIDYAGIFLEYAHISRPRHMPIRKMTELHENIRQSLAFFGRENSRVLEYRYDNSLFSKWKKPPIAFTPDNPTIRDDICWYTEVGFACIASFACFLGEDDEALYGEPDFSAFA